MRQTHIAAATVTVAMQLPKHEPLQGLSGRWISVHHASLPAGYTLLLKVEFSGRSYNCDKYYIANPDAPPVSTHKGYVHALQSQ
jgi:hypothetical protein